MNELTPKRVADSRVEQIQVVLNSHINGAGRLFGGQLMEWIDIVAGVVARRHSNRIPTTASIDNLQFKEPVYVNNTIVLFGKVTYVGRTSMEVQVDTFVEHLDGERKLVNTAYLVMVALDENDHPTPVPSLILESDEEEADWNAGERRDNLRRQRRIEKY
ncbi:acyl-CoA thioesterase [Faecalispora anaeroviscerum]|uniref:acyl-CoA thioesterase n=1 Tax=Faecalispora anaeroviscerum TaxID=2991836 RepID=UPI0024BA8B2F|nr:acyl-CoA thioesterase [Faecalispora anaeroviscerum]